MVAQKFSECFWDEDFNSTQGFDKLIKRVKDGRSAVKDVESFIKERAKIESDYSKSLAQLASRSMGNTESGSMRDILMELKKQSEKAASIHQDLSQNLSDQAQRIQQIKDKHQSLCKQAESTVKTCQGSKKDLYNKTKSNQQNYQKKSQAYDQAHHAYLQEKGSNTKGPKELEKLDNKTARCKEEKLRADDSYHSFVTQLENSRQLWETEMTKMCDTFQELELERIGFLRNEIWIHVNMHSTTLYDVDQGNDIVREKMSCCDPKKDVQEFINTHQTGNKRPAWECGGEVVWTFHPNVSPAAVEYESCDQKPTPSISQRPRLPAISSPSPAVAGGSTFFGAPRGRENSFEDPTYASIP